MSTNSCYSGATRGAYIGTASRVLCALRVVLVYQGPLGAGERHLDDGLLVVASPQGLQHHVSTLLRMPEQVCVTSTAALVDNQGMKKVNCL